MAKKVDKLFVEYEKALQNEKKYVDGRGLAHHGDDGEDPLPSPYSSGSSASSSHHSRRRHRQTSKKHFLKLDVNFEFPMYAGECNVEKVNNWIRQIEVYYWT